MHPVLAVEFTARAGDEEFKEESITFHDPEAFFAFIAPGGGCERIPDEVGEIRVIFLPVEHPNVQNPVADVNAVLQLHRVIFTGPLAEILQTGEQILDRVGRSELSPSFLAVSGILIHASS